MASKLNLDPKDVVVTVTSKNHFSFKSAQPQEPSPSGNSRMCTGLPTISSTSAVKKTISNSVRRSSGSWDAATPWKATRSLSTDSSTTQQTDHTSSQERMKSWHYCRQDSSSNSRVETSGYMLHQLFNRWSDQLATSFRPPVKASSDVNAERTLQQVREQFRPQPRGSAFRNSASAVKGFISLKKKSLK